MPKSSVDDMVKGFAAKKRRENRRFWIPVVISIIALIVSAISLYLQSKSRLRSEPLKTQQPIKQNSVPLGSTKIDSSKFYPKQKIPVAIKK